MSAPLRFHVLVDWMEGRLGDTAAQQVAEAVAVAEPATQETVAWIEEFLQASARMPLVAPPPELSQRLRDAFDRFHAPSRTDGWVDADLTHDTRATGTAGFRSASTHVVDHLIFHSTDVEVLLEVSRRARDEVDLDGLVRHAASHTPVTGAEVALTLAGDLEHAARTGADGRFTFGGVPADVHELWITHGESRVRLRADLTIQP